MHQRPHKPALRIQPTTLWEYPSQHYGDAIQGDSKYVGATPSYVIWNLVERYTKPGDLVVDPFCGSGTTLDVAKDTGRKARGFDLSPYRPDIERADARKLPLEAASVDLVFMDPPYGDHIDYSDDPACIGKLSAYDPRYYQAMHRAIREAQRVLKPGGVLAAWAYSDCRVTPAVDALKDRVYVDLTGPYWPPERDYVDAGYRTIPMPFGDDAPFEEIAAPAFEMRVDWDAAQLVAYLRSWSATQRYIKANGSDPVATVEAEIREAWGDPAQRRAVRWDFNVRCGRLR